MTTRPQADLVDGTTGFLPQETQPFSLEIGATSVAVAVAAPHRAAAFDACRFMIDTLKRTVPIWKKETFEDGEVWIEGGD